MVGELDFERISAEWVQVLRGRRSQAEFSRYLGYRSNVVHRWESGASWPTASKFLQACESRGKDVGAAYKQFLRRGPDWLQGAGPSSAQAVAALLRRLKGKVTIATLAQLSGYNRYAVSRWLDGKTEPRLPEFLTLVEAASRRSLDFIATLEEPSRLPSVSGHWERLQALRKAAYEETWSHAVLRALELTAYRDTAEDTAQNTEQWLSGVLGISRQRVENSLKVLEETKQITQHEGRWVPLPAMAVSTGSDPETMGELTRAWTEVALQRLALRNPGHYGYSLFAVSRSDLRRLRELNLEYIREMQSIISRSQPSECVGLLCVHLLDLNGHDNALG